jgi:predicted nucleic acid-binding protein
MKSVVVDASVAAKWFLPEDGVEQARRLLDGKHALLAPDLLWTEVASVAWKYARKGILTRIEAERLVAQALVFPVETHPCEPLLLSDALRLALEHDRTIYDSLYLALAVRESATLVTEDARLVRSLAGSKLSKRVSLLADVA